MHSLAAVAMSPHCVWLVIVGGYKYEMEDDGESIMKNPFSTFTFITNTNRLMMIIELGKIK